MYTRISLFIGLAVAAVTWVLWTQFARNDLWLAYGAASYLLQGLSPYSYPTDGWPSNAMPTVLFLLPFVALGIPLGATGPLLLGLAGGLYSYGSLRANEPGRLLALLSLPALTTMLYSQWDILLLAVWVIPSLAALSILKPHVGWPFGLLNFTPMRAAAVLCILVASFLARPGWVGDWLAQTTNFDGFFPVLGPAALGLFVLFLRRDRDTWLYAGLLLSPIRLWHDPLLAFATIRTARSHLILVACSYVAVLITPLGVPAPIAVGICIYIPCATLLLLETTEHTQSPGAPQLERY
jgi:hypothetical protein